MWKISGSEAHISILTRISQNRFTRYLNFIDNVILPARRQPGCNRLGKVRLILDAVSQTLQLCYNMSQEVAADEATISS